jgi:hypothetical protein
MFVFFEPVNANLDACIQKLHPLRAGPCIWSAGRGFPKRQTGLGEDFLEYTGVAWRGVLRA